MKARTCDREEVRRNNGVRERVYTLMNNVVESEGKEVQKTLLQSASLVCLVVLGALLLATGIVLRVSVMNTGVRTLVAATLVFAVYTVVVLVARMFETNPRTFYPFIFFVGMGILWASLAGKMPDVDRLSESYVSELIGFKGRNYVSGGEARTGVDCSGLARSGLWQAMLEEGIRTYNPHLLGPNLWRFWWRDLSAADLLNKKHGYTIEVTRLDKLAGYDHTYLQPGDIAVTDGGTHALIYVGENKWIEASPEDGKVVVNTASEGSKRPYFNTRVTLMRWWILHAED